MTGEPRGRCQCHGLEYTNRTGAENLQVLTGDWIEDRALCTNLKASAWTSAIRNIDHIVGPLRIWHGSKVFDGQLWIRHRGLSLVRGYKRRCLAVDGMPVPIGIIRSLRIIGLRRRAKPGEASSLSRDRAFDQGALGAPRGTSCRTARRGMVWRERHQRALGRAGSGGGCGRHCISQAVRRRGPRCQLSSSCPGWACCPGAAC